MEQHSLLSTKLYIPPIRPELVWRPHLIERLNAGLDFELGAVTLTFGTEDQNEGMTAFLERRTPEYKGW